jgi:hypothetical protein
MGSDEEGTLAQLKAHRRALVDPKIKQHRGRIVKTTGDGMLVEFASVVEAVCCAVDIQNGMVKRNAELPQEKRIEFRVGINLGDIMIDGNDIFGDGVNVAARLEAIAEPGGIFISRQVYDQIEGKVAFRFRKLGPRDLKNIAKPVEVFAIDGIGRSDERSVVGGPEPIQEIKYCRAFDGVPPRLRDFRQRTVIGEVRKLDEPSGTRLAKPYLAACLSRAVPRAYAHSLRRERQRHVRLGR